MTNQDELQRRLADHEDRLTERKSERVKDADLRRTLVGFANTVSGDETAVLYIGLADDGRPQGVSNPDGLQKRIREALQDCYPAITYQPEVLNVDEKTIVAVVVPHSARKPHFAGPAYVRVGSETVEATEQQYKELLARSSSKVDTILDWKAKVISVVSRGKRLGSTDYLGDARYQERHDCEVKDCDAHRVLLYSLQTSRYCAEPLDNVTITTDEKRGGRLMLLVTERSPRP